jgi:quinol monooxygenase YgiN
MPVLVVNINPNPGKSEAVEAVFLEVIGAVHEEDGCDLYALNRGKHRLVLIEKWRDMDALKIHGAGANLKLLNEKLEGLLASPLDVQILTSIPSGDEVKGAV